MNETLFYVLGLALVAIALIVSFVGLRFERFPTSRGLLVGGTVALTGLVLATMVFAWRNAEDEQQHREEELAEAVEANEAAGDTAEVDEETGGQATGEGPDEVPTEGDATSPAAASADTELGSQVFASAGCTGCHMLADAGSSATTGPDLDAALQGKDEQFIRESIVDPNALIANDYPPDVMPQTYEEQLTPEELDALIAYLAQAASGNG